ncbi:MAG TPA: S9 family peptidase [Streptosporangiaceae bacterium]|jgi:dipeptidyl aminopeptidase/acylaminoacyl peptidase
MPDLIPLPVLFGNPERVSPGISPDGTQLAWIAPHEGVLNVWLAPVSRQDGVDLAAARVMTDDTDRGIRQFDWAHDGRHLLYIQDTGGDENWRLHDVDIQTMEHRDLTPFDGVQTQLIAMERKLPNEILVGLNRDNPQLHDVYRLDLASGELTKELDNPGFAGWVADPQLQVRAAIAPQPDGGFVLMVRDGEQDGGTGGAAAAGESEASPAAADAGGPAGWRPLLTVPGEDAGGTNFVDFSGDGQSLLMTSSVGAQTARLTRVDIATGAVEVLAEDPVADVGGVRTDPDTREPQIVSVVKSRAEYIVLDPSVADDLAAIRDLNHGDPIFLSADDDDSVWLVGFTVDDGPIPYYAYDRATKTAQFLFEQRPELSRYELAAMEPFSFTARDGVTVHGYLTFPAGAERSGLPAVLNVHGGPWARDMWGWNPEAQWLANRGYLCIQVNFRGSTGYGKQFLNAGDREWGAAMQDDLSDAVAHAVSQGWADPARVAIYGGSYGGYAALAGATFTPDLYCCAVDIVGPSNLITLIKSVPPYWAPMIAQFHRRVGNPDTEEEFLWSRSPLSRAEDIRIPLLIAQGANDPRVKQAESEQIVAALQKAGIPHDYMLFPDEGHGFAKPENRLRFYAAADQFLARYLGGRAADPEPAQ